MDPRPPGILLRDGSASVQFLRVLRDATAAFPEAFSTLELPPSADEFRAGYSDLLPQFEACRQRSRERTRIAQHLATASRDACAFWDGERHLPLQEAVAADAAPLDLEALPPRASEADISVPFRGELLRGAQLQEWIDQLFADHKMTTDAHRALRSAAEAQHLDLSGRRVVVFGAGAAIAPVALLRRSGATVLWISRTPPAADAAPGPEPLWFAPGGADLLLEPQRVRATLLEFADGTPLDIALFAYAPGKGREWRLTAAMNAIVDALPPESIRTASLFNSPSIPVRLTPRELERARAPKPAWQGLAKQLGMLGRGAGYLDGDLPISRSVLETQGVSYLAAQYLCKGVAAEAWATRESPVHVSANTAPISLTPSLDKRFFRLSFHGARVFGIEAYSARTTRNLSGLLMLHDWFDPEAPGNPARSFETPRDRAEAMQAVRVHGGVHGLSSPAEPTLRLSYLVGAAWPWGQRI